MTIGLIGSGSWGTALVKILTDAQHRVTWCVRSEKIANHIRSRKQNPNYLSSVHFATDQLEITIDPSEAFRQSDLLVLAVPSAYLGGYIEPIDPALFENRLILSAVKGILPRQNILLNEFLVQEKGLQPEQYFTVMGPCHAEEVAAEKLSYLTFSGVDEAKTEQIASLFRTPYLNTVVNTDVYGVQYAAILKNIYALGAGIAHGLEYGDNFLAVYIANAADEMAGFLRKVGIRNIEVGVHTPEPFHQRKSPNYAASVYLGDLLVTCYSLFSRNRTFGNMIGKGYSVQSAQLELNMVAEGYNASKSIFRINQDTGAEMPLAEAVYRILWEQEDPQEAFRRIEAGLN